MIRSTNHKLGFANIGKRGKYSAFIAEYRRCAVIYLDFLWNNEIQYTAKDNNKTFNISNELLDVPPMLSKASVAGLVLDTNLSARVLKCCLTQVLGSIRAATKKQQKRIYQYTRTQTTALAGAIERNKCVKPNLTKLNPEINSICIEFIKNATTRFSGIIELKSLGIFKKFSMPIMFHRRNTKYKDWTRLNSFLLRDDSIDFRWEKKIDKQKGKTVGADQGILEILTLSDGQVTGNSLSDLMKQLARKKKGSMAFRRKAIERDNFIREQLNKLDFSNIGKVKLEQVKDLRKGKRVSATMTHWTYALIERKMQDLSETEGFVLQMNPSAFKSQRCSGCGLVRKENRNGKIYSCANCGTEIDSDLNAAKNHQIDLPPLPMDFREKYQCDSFIWNETAAFDMNGVELQSHFPKNNY